MSGRRGPTTVELQKRLDEFERTLPDKIRAVLRQEAASLPRKIVIWILPFLSFIIAVVGIVRLIL